MTPDEHDEDLLPTALTVEQFEQRLADLQAHGSPDATIFSDLDRAKVRATRRAWPQIPLDSRRQLVRTMNELSEDDITYNFSRVLKVALHDADPEVRAAAIAGLWEDESEDLLEYLLNAAITDDDQRVREGAAQALARFCQRDAEEELDARWHAPLRTALLTALGSQDSLEVRRRALEAVAAYADDPTVLGEIQRAYDADDEVLQMSALYAMGRNLHERWLPIILESLASSQPGLRFEAIRASGEYGDRRAVPALVELLGDEDREIQLAAIGALGRISGDAALKILRRLAASQDEVVRDAADAALDEATFLQNPINTGGRIDRNRR